ncbi:hypothetical protein C0J52_23126, partial [Blattella germanica]
ENKINCCNKKEVTVECHNLERAELTRHGDENKNVIVESELHLFDALNEVGCDEKNMDIRIVKYVIGQKDFALRQKDEVIKLKDEMIFQLQERIKLLMDHLKLLNKVNIESELSEHARHNTHIKCRENNVDPANSAKEDNSDIFIGNKVKVVSDSETKTSSDIDTTSDVSNEIKEPKSTRTDFVKNNKVRLVQKPTLCGKLVHSQEEEEETLENGASDKPNNQLEGNGRKFLIKSSARSCNDSFSTSYNSESISGSEYVDNYFANVAKILFKPTGGRSKIQYGPEKVRDRFFGGPLLPSRIPSGISSTGVSANEPVTQLFISFTSAKSYFEK